MSTRRGVERGSVAMKGERQAQPVSEAFFSQSRLMRAMIRLWQRVVGQSHLSLESQVVGNSISVGIRIFSIVGDLVIEVGRTRGFELLLLIRPNLRLLHRLKRREGALG